MNKKTKLSKKILIISITIATILTILVSSFIIYTNDYYKAIPSLFITPEPIDSITVKEDFNNNIVYKLKDSNSKIGFIFYPGGKVDEKAYHNLAISCANYDITTIIVSMPFNLAVFDINAAENIINNHPEIEKWYIGGHSLGGSMAASYTSKNEDKISGLILLASYSTAEIKSLKTLSIYGSSDKILNLEKYEEYKPNLTNLNEHIIEGGNHANFGSYGIQEGDGESSINPNQQISHTVNLIKEFIFNN